MSIWTKIFGGSAQRSRIDYYEEALALSKEGKFHDALTSLRLALRDSPGDPVVLQQIAIAYTRIGMDEEAAKTYRHVLQRTPDAPGAHYGLAFLLLRQGARRDAARHLEAFLAARPSDEEAGEHIAHAERTLQELQAGGDGGGGGEAAGRS